VETGPPEQVIGSPANAYTRELLATAREAASST
jgi:ABC-type dipeptide/oligopeptide/nickel transport system ATPase component